MIKKKIVMLGSWGVGKTSLVRQFVENVFEDKYLSTLGVKVDTKQVQVDGKEIKLMLWDIAGAEDNFSVPMNYLKGAAGCLLVVDGTRKESLQTALELKTLVEKEIGALPFVVAANKSDLQWQLSNADLEDAFPKPTDRWFSTSAKTGQNVEALFQEMAERVNA
ncbi:MAG: GTP-binding protein [Gammaproteobacteria bacterium]|nr:GTP-binding protein [Gammaproteobacteria bacterium]